MACSDENLTCQGWSAASDMFICVVLVSTFKNGFVYGMQAQEFAEMKSLGKSLSFQLTPSRLRAVER